MNEKQPFPQSQELQEHQRLHAGLVPEAAPRREPTSSMEEHAAYPAPERVTPDWRRLDVAVNRWGDRIAAGLSYAAENDTQIGRETARTIAHVLGRAFGRMSALAGYGRTGEGEYEQLRDEYLALAQGTETGWVKELVDTYGSYLVREKYPDVQTTTYMRQDHAKLEHLLVPTEVELDEQKYLVHVPGIYGRETIEDLTTTLAELQIDQDAALRAYLSLPDVSAVTGDVMVDFHSHFIGTYPSLEDAIYELSGVEDRIEEVHEYAAERHLIFDNISPDYEALAETMEAGFDIVEDDTGKRRVYAFYK
ncbi:hypothetical protein M2390_000289 [Mycetocola sp. BIGb0189]|uniref:hypothetical protein n=1 Tax=Mycetocola sp. BIGb0189 TaxID=2940604 RepID=UPI002166DE59|nr:hypothetical protein [Mycetocola sp. BIGb0189]MCS4275131.1 hypothetical protein [Mycetocola sp. BIGb0189]